MARMLACLRFLILSAFAALTVIAAEKKMIAPKDFPPGRPYSAGILLNGTLYVAGQIGQDWRTGKIPEDFEAEVRQCFRNIHSILQEAHMTFDDVVSVQVYLTDMTLFNRMNAVYTTYFKDLPRPARTTVGVANLAASARIEITVTAHNERAEFMPMRQNP